MRSNQFKATLVDLLKAGLAASILLLASGESFAASVDLNASATSATLPDGQVVPMWGYTCTAESGALCASANPDPKLGAGWSPVVIRVRTRSLTINLTNNLPGAVPTSLVIVGQLGGGLGDPLQRTTTPSPGHAAQGTTWPGAGPADASSCLPGGNPGAAGTFCPPAQAARVRSFATEVQTGKTKPLTWDNLKPGTYLIESGTHPSIQGPMGLYGVLVVDVDGQTGYPKTKTTDAVTYNADVPLLLSEIDPVQNAAVAAAVATAGFSETRVWSGQADGCGNPASATFNTCYPPAVNYDPRYYLVNGVSFDRTAYFDRDASFDCPGTGPNASRSLFKATYSVTGDHGTVLVRFVNAGLRMHVPSIVGAQTGSPAASGFSLIAEDGNVLPGVRRVQSEVFLAAGKTYDVLINAPATCAAALPVFDRQLSLSTNNQRDGGMQAYIGVNGSVLPSARTTATAHPDSYFCVAGTTLVVSDPSKGVLANDTGANGAVLDPTAVSLAGLTLQSNGTFTYTPTGTTCGGTFTYLVNGTTAATATISQCDANVQGAGCSLGGAPTAVADSYTSTIATRLQESAPGVLVNDTDPSGRPLSAVLDVCSAPPAGFVCLLPAQVTLNSDGSFTASLPGAGNYTFQYHAVNTQKSASAVVNVSITSPSPTGLQVVVKDAKNGGTISDYRWLIEEDRTFYVDPACQVNTLPRPLDSRGLPCPALPVTSLGTNFHTSHMPVVAQGCVGTVSCEAGQTLLGVAAVCDVGNGACRAGTQKTPINPSEVALDPNKRYYLSIFPGDGVNPVIGGAGGPMPVDPNADPNNSNTVFRQFDITKDCGPYTGIGVWEPGGLGALCGHAMGGAQIVAGQTSATPINVSLQQTPLTTAKISVFVFQDDNPLNGENDAGGGNNSLSPNEAGLGGFELKLLDQAGNFGDSTGQITYDMFNMPVSNSLAGTIDPATGLDACPISKKTDGLVGMIPTCPKFESDGTTLSPLAGQAIIANLYPGLYEVVATPAADRIGRGEEWLQTNTLDGTKAHEAFIKPGEPGYFQEFGPGGYHVAIGFANPAIINARKAALCASLATATNPTPCSATITGLVTNARMSRTPDQRVYSSGSYDSYSFTQCYVSLGSPDGADFAFAKCNPDGTFTFTSMPTGNFKVTVFDQWNDLLVDGLSTPVVVGGSAQCTAGNAPVCNFEIPVTQWRTNLYTRTFIDLNGDGISTHNTAGVPCTAPNTPSGCNANYGSDTEPGLPLVATNIRFRDGSFGFFNNTDLNGYAGFNEVFPFLNWLVVETDSTRYKQTGVHVVYDAGGPVDGTTGGGGSTIAAAFANTIESPTAHVPSNLRVPGARYCASADCPAGDPGFDPASGNAGSTGRVDPGWVSSEAWAGLLGQNSFIEFAKKPFAAGENGGIKGHVIYASTRPFDDPTLSLQLSWEPGVPNVKFNLYQVGAAPDGTRTLKLVDTTTSTSFDDWAQGFHLGADGVTQIPNMSCPGQETTSPFYFTLENSRQWLNPTIPMPANSQFKCYDGWSMLNQLQPAPYDGMYKFPSVTARDPVTGKPTATGTNCTACVPNTAVPMTDYDYNAPMLPPGKYVVEVILPAGYELVKEEDKNILLGDTYIAPVTQQFAGLGSIFILPDQAAMNAFYNRNNKQNPTTNLGAVPRHEGDTGMIETFWPCVGTTRIVPDYNSLFPGAQQVAPFAGASRPLCDRKEVTLEDQMSVLAKFYIFSSTHVAGHYTGTITNDFASEFDPFSPQFGEKFAVPNLPVSFKDFAGNEVTRVYSDQWGLFNGLTFSSYAVNPPNPTGYIPQMMIACMNDPGPIPGPNGTMITDPMFNPAYSNFCYETPFMPGQTQYMDTPVIPTMAFAEGYNLPDCEYPDTTPAISSVIGDSSTNVAGALGTAGPWVTAAAGRTLTINALGDKKVLNHAYSGPTAATNPFNQKFIMRHYGFGAAQGTGSVTIGGVNALVSSWSDTSITVTVPDTVPLCTLQQSGTGNGGARCGELEITAGNGKKSIDTVTVTVGGKAPTYVTPSSIVNSSGGPVTEPVSPDNAIQLAIDKAAPGDLIIVGPGMYRENLLMWKPLRLQGVGAASVTINADAHPSGKMEPWRRQVNCLFGLALNGRPISASNPYDATNTYSCAAGMRQRVDRTPMEAIVGWDASGNGNLAQLLQEPTLMGAFEGAGITVLGRGFRIPDGSSDFFGATVEGGLPTGAAYLTASDTDCTPSSADTQRDYGTSNFLCNPSRIDGISVTNSSQGGGAIFMHGWNHGTEVANTRIYANHGTLTGGISVGHGEFGVPYVIGSGVPIPFDVPGDPPEGAQLGYGYNKNVRVHHNAVTSNASIGDALYSGTPSAAGGVTFCTGADNYKFNYNWVCGNLSTGDGGGVAHAGFSNDGEISHNWIVFNQSANPTIPTHGGGLAILGGAPDSNVTLPNGTVTECGNVTDVDCPPGLSEGTGRNLVIDANLIMGNSAESGSGGGLRLQAVNGQEVATFATDPTQWYQVTVTNNIIANNVAGWDGGGVSLQDALKVNFINNTVISNDTTASAGVLFNTLGAPFASVPPPNCNPNLPSSPTNCAPVVTSTPQAAGLVTMQNTSNLTASLPAEVTCPDDHENCRYISYPLLRNNVFWQNRAFNIAVSSGFGPGQQDQQHLVTLVPQLNQTATGQCASGPSEPSYWDIGVRGDTGPANHSSGVTLNPENSILSSGGYGGSNLASNPLVIQQYCNGSRLPPENGGHGYNVPPGRSETTGLSPVFALNNLTPAATVDEGNNWINMSYGPLALSNPALYSAAGTAIAPLGNYSITFGSPAINNASSELAPNHDFFGNIRPASGVDIGAVEYGAVAPTPTPPP